MGAPPLDATSKQGLDKIARQAGFRGKKRTDADPITIDGDYGTEAKGTWSMEMDPYTGMLHSRTFTDPNNPADKYNLTFNEDGSMVVKINDKVVENPSEAQQAVMKKSQELTEKSPGFDDKVIPIMAQGKKFESLGTKDKPYSKDKPADQLAHAADQASELYKKFQKAYHDKDPNVKISTEDLKRLKALDTFTQNEYAKLDDKVKSGAKLEGDELKFYEKMTKEWKTPDGKDKEFKEPSVGATLNDIAKGRSPVVKSEYQPVSPTFTYDEPTAEQSPPAAKQTVNGPKVVPRKAPKAQLGN